MNTTRRGFMGWLCGLLPAIAAAYQGLCDNLAVADIPPAVDRTYPELWEKLDAIDAEFERLSEITEKYIRVIRWIPVTERLPDKPKGDPGVLVADSNRGFMYPVYTLHWRDLHDCRATHPTVTHWAELPAPPVVHEPEPVKLREGIDYVILDGHNRVDAAIQSCQEMNFRELL